MLRKILGFGLIAGLIAGAPMSLLIVTRKDHLPVHWGMVIGYLTMLLAFSTIFIAIKRRRDTELGGVIRFWPALGIGLGISLIAGVIYATCWEIALAWSQLDFAADWARMTIEQSKAKGLSGPALDKVVAEMEAFKQMYAQPHYRMAMTFAEIFPVGLLVSLVAAGLLRNPRFLPLRR